MDLAYNEEYEAFRGEVQEFLKKHKADSPRGRGGWAKADEEARAWQQLLIKHGYAARTIPKEYGGYGAEPDILKNHIIAEEFAKAKVRPGHSGDPRLVPVVLELGTEEQKQAYIGPTISGDMVWCQGYSEPGAGSDLASLTTKAVLEGDEWVINGQKIWTSGAQYADMIFCMVRTEPDKPKHDGISYLIFSMDTPGIEVRPLVTMTGDAIFNETFFTDVRVPKDQIIGKRGEGWYVANATLKHERGSLGDPNQLEGRFRSLVEILKEETIDGKPLIEFPAYRDRLLKLQGQVLSMKYNGMRILTASAQKQEPGMPRWLVKLIGCELNNQMSALAIDAMGELGVLYDGSPYLRNYGMWQRNYMLDIGLIIGGGTAQIQKNMISERALGMPKEPKFEDS